jgi:hypothetical protein
MRSSIPSGDIVPAAPIARQAIGEDGIGQINQRDGFGAMTGPSCKIGATDQGIAQAVGEALQRRHAMAPPDEWGEGDDLGFDTLICLMQCTDQRYANDERGKRFLVRCIDEQFISIFIFSAVIRFFDSFIDILIF